MSSGTGIPRVLSASARQRCEASFARHLERMQKERQAAKQSCRTPTFSRPTAPKASSPVGPFSPDVDLAAMRARRAALLAEPPLARRLFTRRPSPPTRRPSPPTHRSTAPAARPLKSALKTTRPVLKSCLKSSTSSQGPKDRKGVHWEHPGKTISELRWYQPDGTFLCPARDTRQTNQPHRAGSVFIKEAVRGHTHTRYDGKYLAPTKAGTGFDKCEWCFELREGLHRRGFMEAFIDGWEHLSTDADVGRFSRFKIAASRELTVCPTCADPSGLWGDDSY